MATVTFGSDGLNTAGAQVTIPVSTTTDVIFLNNSRSRVILDVAVPTDVDFADGTASNGTLRLEMQPAEYRVVPLTNTNTTIARVIGFATVTNRAQAVHATGAQEGQTVTWFTLGES